MSTCCGEYHLADCPTFDRYASECDLGDPYDAYADFDYVADPATCDHGDWNERIVQGHTWFNVHGFTPARVQCRHCGVRTIRGAGLSVQLPPCPKVRLERTCSLCESDLIVETIEEVL